MFRLTAMAIMATAGAMAMPVSAQTAPAAKAQPAAAAPAPDAFGGSAAVSENDLKATTGREDLARMAAIATQRSTVSNNSVTGTSVTGNVQIDGQAFQNLQGLAVINANSGNNVAINSAMNVTINMAPQ